MNIIPTANWTHTSKHEPRGYIDPQRLKELWFHTGTACNLECPFCLEGSKPGDDRLGLLTLEDVKPYIDEAIELGVEQFSFTGGEPFVAKALPNILAYAAQFKPCLVLTNGTDAVTQRRKAIAALTDTPFPISFRISIDYANAAAHDAGRGEGRFDQAWQGIKMLSEMGFHVSVARQAAKGENRHDVDAQYHALFAEHGLQANTTLVAFPDFSTPFAQVEVPEITENCMTTYQTAEQRDNYMCAFSKMLVKEQGQMKIYACTLVDDDPRYGFVGTLKESLEQRVMLGHHRCFSCFSCGASCSEL